MAPPDTLLYGLATKPHNRHICDWDCVPARTKLEKKKKKAKKTKTRTTSLRKQGARSAKRADLIRYRGQHDEDEHKKYRVIYGELRQRDAWVVRSKAESKAPPTRKARNEHHRYNVHKKKTAAEQRAEQAQQPVEKEIQLKREAEEKMSAELQDALANAEGDVDSAVRMFMKRHNENQTLQTEVETMRKCVQQAESQQKSLETALGGLRSKLDAFQFRYKEIREMQQKREELRREKEIFKRRQKDATRALQQEKAQLEAVKSALATQQQETVRLQAENTQKETEQRRLKEESDARVRALEAEKSREENLRKEIAARVGNNPEHMTWEWELSPGAWQPMAAAVCHELDARFMEYRKRNMNFFRNWFSKGRDYALIENFEMAGATYLIDFEKMTQHRRDTGKVRKIRVRVDVPRHWKRNFSPDTMDLRSLKDTSMATVLRKVMLGGDGLCGFFLNKLGGTHCGSTCPYDLTTASTLEIYQVENLPLWRKYEQARTNVRQDHRRCDIKRGAILPAVPGAIRDAAHVLLGDEPELCPDVNEVYLFHGTHAEGLKKIATTGFDFRVAKDTGLYGQGTYFASNVCKSLQYTGRNRRENKGYLIIARVLVGDPHYTTRTCPEIKHGPENGATGLFRDSIIANAGPMQGHHNGSQAHQEFVIFDKAHAYPEFVIEYSE
eukprot:g11987.t1